MKAASSGEQSINDKRIEIRKLLEQRQVLREEYAYWSDVYAANYDQVAYDLMQMVAAEGDRLNGKIGAVTQSILTLWGEYYDHNKGEIPPY